MKVVFLDFDGVLNSRGYLSACGEVGVVINPANMEILKEIIEKTNARIVLTTSWREHWSRQAAERDNVGEEIHAVFHKYNLEIYDKTPTLPGRREGEIQHWLETHPETEQFVILDDQLLSGEFLKGHFIKTSDYFGGLNQEDGRKAVEILME